MEMLEALNQFRICCSCCRVESLEGEFINDTFWVVNSNGKKEDYLLQRVNHKIFRDASVLMKNISSILNYLYLNEALTKFKSINLLETKVGGHYYRDRMGFYWRLFQIPGRQERQKITETREGAYEWAKAFGRFLSCLDEFPVQSHEEIVFTRKRILDKLKKFERATDPFFSEGREVVQDEIDYVFKWTKQGIILDHLLEPEEYPTMSWNRARVANG